MACNEGNEPGNDTAAPAFQVGDRVEYGRGTPAEGVGVVELVSDNPAYRARLGGPRERNGWLTVQGDDGAWHTMRHQDATLIARGTPAPAPAIEDRVVRVGDTVRYQCECGYQHEFDGVVTAVEGGDRLTIHTHEGADIQRRASAVVIVARDASEPPTPAPAATPPALDTHTLMLQVESKCDTCDGEGNLGSPKDECPVCDGDGWFTHTFRISGEALDRLAAALAKRLPRVVRMRGGLRY